MSQPTEAGKGNHHVYRIAMPGADQDPLKANENYLGVDAVAWYINKQSSWFTNRMASGTLDIKIQGGVEEYQAALGTFDLKDGSYYAPVFDRPVLPDRNYRGGPVTIGSMLSAIANDTVVAGLLKSAATASLGVASGMVETATAAGPLALLGAAGGELIKGVKTVLSDTGDKREALFDFSAGLEATLSPDKIVGPECYLLLHRGAELDQNALTIQATGELSLPYLNGTLLNDGCWMLIRLRRTSTYSGQRPWYDTARKLRNDIQNVVTDYQNNVITRDQALQRLQPTTTGNTSVYDNYALLRSVIQADGVLTEKEATVYSGALTLAITKARDAVQNAQPSLLANTLTATRTALMSGRALPMDVALVYTAEREAITAYRRAATMGSAPLTELLVNEGLSRMQTATQTTNTQATNTLTNGRLGAVTNGPAAATLTNGVLANTRNGADLQNLALNTGSESDMNSAIEESFSMEAAAATA